MFVVCISTSKKKTVQKKNCVTHLTKNNPANDVLFKLYKSDSQYLQIQTYIYKQNKHLT